MLSFDLESGIKKVSATAQSMVDTTIATVSGAVSEVKGQVLDPLVQAIEQPIAGLAHGVGNTANMLRVGTYVAGGWLLWNMYQEYYVAPSRKRALQSTIDNSIQRSFRRRRL